MASPTKRKASGTHGDTPTAKRAKHGDQHVHLQNPHLSELGSSVDHLYHLGLDTSMPLEAMFGDVKFVLMGGSAHRAEDVAKQLVSALKVDLPVGTALAPIGKTERYFMYKVRLGFYLRVPLLVSVRLTAGRCSHLFVCCGSRSARSSR